jgi:hypothetical protein
MHAARQFPSPHILIATLLGFSLNQNDIPFNFLTGRMFTCEVIGLPETSLSSARVGAKLRFNEIHTIG